MMGAGKMYTNIAYILSALISGGDGTETNNLLATKYASMKGAVVMRITWEFGKQVDRLLELARRYATASSRAALYEERCRIALEGEAAVIKEAELLVSRNGTLERLDAANRAIIAELKERLREFVQVEGMHERTIARQARENGQLTERLGTAETRAKIAETENTELRREVKQWFVISLVLMIFLGLPLALFAFGLVQPLIGGHQDEFSPAQLRQIERMVSQTEVTLDPAGQAALERIADRMENAAQLAALTQLLQRGDLPLEPLPLEPKAMEFIEQVSIDESPFYASAPIQVDSNAQLLSYGWTGGNFAKTVGYNFETVIFPNGPENGMFYVVELGFNHEGKIAKVVLSYEPADRINEVPVE